MYGDGSGAHGRETEIREGSHSCTCHEVLVMTAATIILFALAALILVLRWWHVWGIAERQLKGRQR